MIFQDKTDNAAYFVISFSKEPKEHFGVFARGYWNAASRLAKSLLASGFPDYDAYPVVFLYRHALELYLKNVIYNSALLMAFQNMDGIQTKLCNDHKLVPLADKVAEILLRLFPEDEGLGEYREKMLAVVRDFAEIDPNSYAYRYPIDTSGNPSTTEHQTINLEALSDIMDDLLDGMDSIDFGLQVETSRAQEIYELLQTLDQDVQE